CQGRRSRSAIPLGRRTTTVVVIGATQERRSPSQTRLGLQGLSNVLSQAAMAPFLSGPTGTKAGPCPARPNPMRCSRQSIIVTIAGQYLSIYWPRLLILRQRPFHQNHLSPAACKMVAATLLNE